MTEGIVNLGEYMEAEIVERKEKTSVWEVRNKKSKDKLALIKWNGNWRQYCMYPVEEPVFSSGCLFEVEKFLKGVNSEHKDRKKDEGR